MKQGPRRPDCPWLGSPPRGRDREEIGWGGQGVNYCQWIEGEPSAEDGCKCGKPVEPIDRALGASLTQRQGSRLIPYCNVHMARAYLPRALRWLKLREFSDAANGVDLALGPLEPRLALFACAVPDPCARGERPLIGRAKARAARREAMP